VATKAGIIGFTKSLAREVAEYGITANMVEPGRHATDMIRPMMDRDMDRWRADTPLGRIGTTEEVAHAVLFLASDGAGYITGESVAVNGGWLME
jgi:3-oxoacyl-[acyl-carrier protein] reductase